MHVSFISPSQFLCLNLNFLLMSPELLFICELNKYGNQWGLKHYIKALLDTSVLPPELTWTRWVLCTNTLFNQTFLQCDNKKRQIIRLCPLGSKDISRNSPRYCYPSLCPHPECLSVEQCNLQVAPVHLQHSLVSHEGNLTLCRTLKKPGHGFLPKRTTKGIAGKKSPWQQNLWRSEIWWGDPKEIQGGKKEIGILTSVLREDSFHSPSPSCLSSPPRFSFGSVMNKASPLDIFICIYNTSTA